MSLLQLPIFRSGSGHELVEPHTYRDGLGMTNDDAREGNDPAATHSKSNAGKSPAIVKPFFIMDWLEEMAADQDAETLAKLLRTPQKNKSAHQSKPRDHALYQDYRDDVPQSPPSCGNPVSSYDNEATSLSCPSTPKSSNRAKASKSPSSAPDLHRMLMEPRNLFPHEDATKTSFPSLDGPGHRIRLPHCRRSSRPAPHKPKREGTVIQRSIKLANGWNAKGLQKASKELWKDALACWDNALEIRLALLGSHHYEVANSYNNRGIALGKLGQFGEALVSLQKALEIRLFILQRAKANEEKEEDKILKQKRDKAVDKNAPVSILQNMANVHQQAGNLAKALEALKNAQEFATGIYLARVCVAMGHVYHDGQQRLDALDAYRDAMGIYQQQLRVAHKTMKSTRDDKTSTDQEQQRTIQECSDEITELEEYIQEHRFRGKLN